MGYAFMPMVSKLIWIEFHHDLNVESLTNRLIGFKPDELSWRIAIITESGLLLRNGKTQANLPAFFNLNPINLGEE